MPSKRRKHVVAKDARCSSRLLVVSELQHKNSVPAKVFLQSEQSSTNEAAALNKCHISYPIKRDVFSKLGCDPCMRLFGVAW
jgi:hypothetical protein